MNYKKIATKLFLPSLLLFGLLIATFVFAQDFGTAVVTENLNNSLGAEGADPRSLATRIINIALGFLAVVAVVIVLYAGVLWMSSAGEEDKITRAKQILKNGLIGLVIVLSAWAIVTFVIFQLGRAGGNTDYGGGNSYCTNGETRACGCGGAMLCTAGAWGPCIGSNWDNCVNTPIDCDSSSLPGCQAADQICANGDFCNESCVCEEKAEAGDSCDADINNQTCDADNNRCGEYLTCNPETCLCAGSPVITALSPLGGFCENNTNQACDGDEDCGEGVKCNLTVANGAPNNFITIFGKNFGEYVPGSSQVVLSGNNQEVEANFPDNINSTCVNFWRDDQIIIAIPQEADTGAIKVVNKEGLADSTDNSYGPQLEDFVRNDINRPSICKLDPIEGSLNLEVNYQGVNLQTGQAYFGNYQNNVSGLYSNFSDAEGLSGSAAVPNIKAGESGSFVEKMVAGTKQKSNYLRFIKNKEEADGPYIISISPESGSAGQYITIKGAGFGGARGNNRVYFVSGENKIEASYSFPAICVNSVWTDKQIIVKAPAELTNGSYYLEVQLDTLSISSKTANPNIFQFNSDLSLAPSLCKLDPEKGPIGTTVNFWGEYFGSAGTETVVRFFSEKNITAKIRNQEYTDNVEGEVPQGAVTGPVKIIKNNLAGNELNFEISECASDQECENQVCCPATSYKKGRCVDTLEQCFVEVPTSVFEWKFSTDFGSTYNPDTASCSGWSKYLGSCFQGAMCPNSPGACSAPETSYTKNVGSCDISCQKTPGCTAATCFYEANLDKCILKNSGSIDVCSIGELLAPIKGAKLEDDRNIPRVMFWPGKINQHWNLTTGAWESDPDGVAQAEVDKLDYCKKFYPTTVRVEEYKEEVSTTWHTALSRTFYSNTNMSYRCILDTNINSVDLAGVKKTCNPGGLWEIKVKGSCPEGWTKQANDICTQNDVICNSCPENLSCEKINSVNSCVSTELCAAQANCTDKIGSSDDECILTVEPGCDCCCRIGFSEQDCCAPLVCAGSCGSDVTAQTNTYGSCSGCAAVGDTAAERDAACNCTGTSGKFCSITESAPQGICTDCAGLTSQESCGEHSQTCCFDSKNTSRSDDDTCRAIGDDAVLSTDKNSPDFGYCSTSNLPKDRCNLFDNNKEACLAEANCCYNVNTNVFKENIFVTSSANYTTGTCISGDAIESGENKGYCAFYDCDTNDTASCNYTPKITGAYSSPAECAQACGNPGIGPGLDCALDSSVLGVCNFNLCTFEGFACLQANGVSGNTSSSASCGACCCRPAVGDMPDTCVTASTPNLVCQTDKGNCTGAGRGLCCGCSADSDCGSASTVGCGSDTCCEARPSVQGTTPATSATGVCRNSAIKISFNQKMDAESFRDNVLVFEEREYGGEPCAFESFISSAGQSEYDLAKNNKGLKKWLSYIGEKIRQFFERSGAGEVLATPPDSGKLYCAIPGQITFDEKINSTDVIFTPNKVLAAGAKYFVLIKGDETLSSNSGVLSRAKIGMNGAGFISLNNPPLKEITINSKTYINSYSFSFTTLTNQGGNNNNGLCLIDSVSVTPDSYLFKTTTNSLLENDDDVSHDSFDQVADSDKLFFATAYSADGQVLFPVDGYNWRWDWTINNSNIVSFNENTILLNNKKIVEAKEGVTDGQTVVSAQVNMDAYENTCGTKCLGDKMSESSEVYVFLCENPWPAPESDGRWLPWSDSPTNCPPGSVCDNFNYKFYYCRDAGEPGTFDDLPAINYSPVTLTGDLICSSDKSPCTLPGAVCGVGGKGFCIWEILKESYFFRNPVVSGVELNSVIDTGLGGEAAISWRSTVNGVKSYKVYYSQSGQETLLSKEVFPLGTGGVCTPSSDGLSFVCSTKINGLMNDENYIFKVSLISELLAESPFSNEIERRITDKTPPATPEDLKVSLLDTRIQFDWKADPDKNVFYRIYYGNQPDKFAGYLDSAPGVSSLVISRDKLTNEKYYFVISAFDSSKNESSKSTPVSIELK